MSQTVLITLTTAGADTGPFDLYSNVDGFVAPFESNISKASLEAGYLSIYVPDAATTIRVASDNPICDNYIDLFIVTTSTTTSSSTSTTSTTSTTTTAPPTTTTTTTQLYNVSVYANLEATLSGGGAGIEYSFNNVDWSGLGGGFNETACNLRGTVSNISSGTTLYLRLVVGVASPVQFGFAQATSSCPGSSTLCVASFVVNATQDCAMTGKVVGGNPVGC